MKLLRISLILLIPAMGIVSCKKSECKPKPAQETQDAGDSSLLQGRSSIDGEIYGSGDDDRDGGDKKKKTAAR